jgi:RNA polymerase sigma-70 factor, ECF subfamily
MQTDVEVLQDNYDLAFMALYESHYRKLFAFVYSRVGNVELSKDLIAEVFERAYVKGRSIREPAAHRAWLFVVANNVVMGHFRQRKRELKTVDRFKESLWLSDRPMEPHEYAVRGEQKASLMRYFRTLSQRDQEVLSLKFDTDLTHAEIAQVTGMTETNVRVSIFRALKRLRERVNRGVERR